MPYTGSIKKGQQMNIIQAEKLAKELMAQHLDDKWKFKFDHAVKRLGACSYRTKTILLSKPLTEVNSIKVIRNTILHEIAHALVGSKHEHDSIWAAKHKELGGTGQPRSQAEVGISNYTGTCPNGHISYTFGKPRAQWTCSKCHPKFNLDYLIVWKKEQRTHRLS